MNEHPSDADVRMPGREQCPTCGAGRSDDPVCYRCRSDLTPLLAIERRADALRAEARRSYALGWYRRTAGLMAEVIRMEAYPEDFRLLACACLRYGDFQTVCRAYARLVKAEASAPPSGCHGGRGEPTPRRATRLV